MCYLTIMWIWYIFKINKKSGDISFLIILNFLLISEMSVFVSAPWCVRTCMRLLCRDVRIHYRLWRHKLVWTCLSCVQLFIVNSLIFVINHLLLSTQRLQFSWQPQKSSRLFIIIPLRFLASRSNWRFKFIVTSHRYENLSVCCYQRLNLTRERIRGVEIKIN